MARAQSNLRQHSNIAEIEYTTPTPHCGVAFLCMSYNTRMPESDIFVVKSNGARERFSFEKLQNSLKHSGAPDELAQEVSDHIQKEMVNGMTTDDIYKHAFAFLHSRENMTATRYSLRRSLLELGPTGFPFEKFIAEVFKHRGFSTLLDQTVQGKCVDHEVDVVAWNDSKLIMAEAKYHHELAYKSDVKVVLYIKARFDDLYASTFSYDGHTKLDEGWLITNTKFTDKAIQYAECSGVRLMGWNYPAKGNLHQLIEETNLHPITSLTTLTVGQKRLLMENGVVLCESITKEKAKMRELGLNERLIEEAETEAHRLCPI